MIEFTQTTDGIRSEPCVKGDVTGDDGKVWDLTGKAVKLDKRVGETATFMGREVHRSKSIEAKMESNEMKEAAGKPYGDFQVTSVKNATQGCGG